MSAERALLIIDCQVGLIDGLPAYEGPKVLGRIGQLLRSARASGTAVIYIQHDGPNGHPVEAGTPAWEIHPAVKPQVGETVIHKRDCDAFFQTDLQKELAARGIMELVVTGAMTEYCVDTACRRATSLGYNVTLVSDAHTTADRPNLNATQIIAHHNALLDGFSAGDHTIKIKAARDVAL